MIKIENLVVTYDKFQLNCSMEVKNGHITGLVGENGAGKTTLFKSILGLTKLKGDIFLNEVNIKDISSKEKENIGVAFSDSFYNKNYTIMNICKIHNNFYPNFKKEKFLKNCQDFNLPLNKKISDFSTGMMAKLKVITTLSHKAEIIILDEPTSGLDVQAREDVINMLHDYLNNNPKACILISSHISSDLEKICDDIYFINNGSIILHDDTDVLLDVYGIIKIDNMEKIDTKYCQFKSIDKHSITLLTNNKQYYRENYPELVIEKPTIDLIILTLIKGEKI